MSDHIICVVLQYPNGQRTALTAEGTDVMRAATAVLDEEGGSQVLAAFYADLIPTDSGVWLVLDADISAMLWHD